MSTDERIVSIVLAAGLGTRMRSSRPKVLHEVAGRPLVAWAVETARAAGATDVVVVVGHGRDQVEAALAERFGASVRTAEQPEPRGTGDAVRCALPAIEGFAGTVVILHGDCTLIPPAAITALLGAKSASVSALAMITATMDDPTGYGRILRDASGAVVGIREHRDCSETERSIREVNPAVYAVDAAFLRDAVARLSANNDQGELYLTDVVADAAARGRVADARWSMADLIGINDRHELALADRAKRFAINRQHAIAGVTIRDPATAWIDAGVVIAQDVTIEPNVVLRGECSIGARARIDVGCVLSDVHVDEDAWLKPYTVASGSRVGVAAQTGPFAHLRPDTDLGPDTRVGNFVETKKTRMGRGSKAGHLAYLGDGEIGEDVNVGAGTIFCNYDGIQKHRTVLEDGCFIGSDTQIVAPITVGKGAYVGTGTTVTRNVPADALAISRPKQVNKEGYASLLRQRFEAAKKAKKTPEGG